MKLFLTADLHYRIHWFRWLIEQAPDFDLVCIAGDLLDMFRSETRMEQACEIRTFVKELADIVPVALCSGNHDNAGQLVSHDRASVYKWFIELGTHRNIITDGSEVRLIKRATASRWSAYNGLVSFRAESESPRYSIRPILGLHLEDTSRSHKSKRRNNRLFWVEAPFGS